MVKRFRQFSLWVYDVLDDRYMNVTSAVDLLNIQQVQIKVYEKSLIRKSKKISEQQATIDKQERRIIVLENLLTNMGIKWVDDDE